ncbi:hypothetical protein ISCGN_017728 [Ixodes scapularis]
MKAILLLFVIQILNQPEHAPFPAKPAQPPGARKATSAIFESAAPDYLHFATVTPSTTTASATKDRALRQFNYGLGSTRGTMKAIVLLFVIQILNQPAHGPFPAKPAQPPGARKATSAIFESAAPDYLHFATITPSTTTASATKDRALRQFNYGLGYTRGTMKAILLLFVIQILNQPAHGPFPAKPAQPPGARKTTSAVFESAAPDYLHFATVTPSTTTASATKDRALRQFNYGLGYTRGTMKAILLLFVIQILNQPEHAPFPAKPAQPPGARKATSAIFESAAPDYLHFATVTPSTTTASATKDRALRQFNYGLGNTRGTMKAILLLFVIQILNQPAHGPFPAKPAQPPGARKGTSAIFESAAPDYLHYATVTPSTTTASATKDRALRQFDYGLGNTRGRMKAILLLFVIQILNQPAHGPFPAKPVQPPGARKATSAIFESAAPDYLHFATVTPSTTTASATKDRALRQFNYGLGYTRGTIKAILLLFVIQILNQPAHGPFPAKPAQPLGARKATSAIFESAAPDYLHFATVTPSTTTASATKDRALRQFNYELGNTRGTMKAILLLFVIQILNQPDHAPFPAKPAQPPGAKKATSAIFESAAPDYLHFAMVTPSTTTASATKDRALRQFNYGLGYTRGTMKAILLLFVIQILNQPEHGPFPAKPAQPPGARKATSAIFESAAPDYLHFATVTPSKTTASATKDRALRQFNYGLGYTRGTMKAILLLFVIQILNQPEHAPFPAKPAQPPGARKATSAIFESAAPDYLHFATVTPSTTTASATKDRALRQFNYGLGSTRGTMKAIVLLFVIQILNQPAHGPFPAKPAQPPGARKATSAIFESAAPDYLHFATVTPSTTTASATKDRALRQFNYGLGNTRGTMKAILLLFVIQILNQPEHAPFPAKPAQPPGARKATSAIFESAAPDYLHFATVTPSTTTASATKDRALRQFDYGLGNTRGRMKAILLLFVIQILNQPAHGPFPAKPVQPPGARKATSAIFEFAAPDYLHFATVTPSTTTASATKDRALRQFNYGLGYTRGTMKAILLLFVIQILNQPAHGPFPAKPAQPPGARKATSAIFESAAPDYLHFATVTPSTTTASATKDRALRQFNYGLGNTRGTMKAILLLFVIQILNQPDHGPFPAKPAQPPGARKATSAIFESAAPDYLHFATVTPSTTTASATKDRALRQFNYGLGYTRGTMKAILLLFVIQILNQPEHGPFPAKPAQPPGARKATSAIFESAAPDYLHFATVTPSTTTASATKDRALRQFNYGLGYTRGTMKAILLLFVIQILNQPEHAPFPAKPAQPPGARKATSAIFESAAPDYLHFATVTPSTTTASATKDRALRQFDYGLGSTRGTMKAILLLFVIQILNQPAHGPFPAKPAQPPGARKATSAIFESAAPDYLHFATVTPSTTTASATKDRALRQFNYGLGNTRGTMKAILLLFVIQILNQPEHAPFPAKPAQPPGARKATSAIFESAAPDYLHFATWKVQARVPSPILSVRRLSSSPHFREEEESPRTLKMGEGTRACLYLPLHCQEKLSRSIENCAGFAVRPSNTLDFHNKADWPGWIQEFENYRVASGLCVSPENVQTIKNLLRKAENPYLSLFAYGGAPEPTGPSSEEILMWRRLRTRTPLVPCCSLDRRFKTRLQRPISIRRSGSGSTTTGAMLSDDFHIFVQDTDCRDIKCYGMLVFHNRARKPKRSNVRQLDLHADQAPW